DTLDYTGSGLHEGSKLIWASAGEKRRELGREIREPPSLPEGFGRILPVIPGIAVVRGPKHTLPRDTQDAAMESLAKVFAVWRRREAFPLLVVVDEPDFCARNIDNFLWVAFTRSDPATDSYGPQALTRAKHWMCSPPLILDARLKSFHAPPLEENPAIAAAAENLAAPGGPLHGFY
ncbi:MAG: 3-octaprenyl-4-hydroxybenzoate carboxy-lyase, partial [Desulfovibrio sp.]|nr:3-octaprenyl-4-hydroxybenzoate carboxy-lyase [Desulfovibrio sp.]